MGLDAAEYGSSVRGESMNGREIVVGCFSAQYRRCCETFSLDSLSPQFLRSDEKWIRPV